MPNCSTSSRLVETATKCFLMASATEASEPSIAPWAFRPSSSQVRASRAFVIVSSVVNVLDTMTTSVVSGSRPLTFSAMSLGSMLET